MNDKFCLTGHLEIDHVKADGTVDKYNGHNEVVDAGRTMITNLLVSDIPVGSRYDWMAIGIGSSTVSGNDVTLGSEYLRVATAGSTTTGSILNDTAQFIGSFGIDATKTVNEAGLFNLSGLDLGSMLSRSTAFTPISATSGDSINVTWKLRVN